MTSAAPPEDFADALRPAGDDVKVVLFLGD
jgi:hypothetical protein